MFENVRQDVRRCGGTAGERLREVLYTPGMWAVLIYRYRRWVRTARAPRVVMLPFKVGSVLAEWWSAVATGITLPASAVIGPGLYIPHTGYVVVSGRARIGRNCTLTQGVTIGHRGGGREKEQGVPVIGDRVYVGPGAAIIGPITVGDDALIGVGAVVVKSVPPRGVAVGNPARVVSRGGSFDLIGYPGMEQDAQRECSLRDAHTRSEAGETSPRHRRVTVSQ